MSLASSRKLYLEIERTDESFFTMSDKLVGNSPNDTHAIDLVSSLIPASFKALDICL